MLKHTLQLSLLIFLFSCGRTPSLESIDGNKWKEDPNGCKGQRLEILNQIKENKEEMKAWSSGKIDAFLGPADKKDLDKRNRVYYVYYIAGSEKCGEGSDHKYLQIRFNSINRADELILFE